MFPVLYRRSLTTEEKVGIKRKARQSANDIAKKVLSSWEGGVTCEALNAASAAAVWSPLGGWLRIILVVVVVVVEVLVIDVHTVTTNLHHCGVSDHTRLSAALRRCWPRDALRRAAACQQQQQQQMTLKVCLCSSSTSMVHRVSKR